LDSLTSLLQRQGFLSPTVTPLTGLITSFISATLGINGWLGLVYQGLSPWKKRQTLLGALRFFPFRELTPARAVLIDQQALLSALQNKRIAGAALDVFWYEPLPVNHPLLELDNLTITPHLAGSTKEVIQRQSKMIVDDVLT